MGKSAYEHSYPVNLLPHHIERLANHTPLTIYLFTPCSHLLTGPFGPEEYAKWPIFFSSPEWPLHSRTKPCVVCGLDYSRSSWSSLQPVSLSMLPHLMPKPSLGSLTLMSLLCSKVWISKQIQKLPILRGSFLCLQLLSPAVTGFCIHKDMVSLGWKTTQNPSCRQNIIEKQSSPFYCGFWKVSTHFTILGRSTKLCAL